MLSSDLFKAWCERLGYPDQTCWIIERIRSAPPSRTVHSRRGNVSGRYPSRKMGVAIQFESHTVELPGIHKMDHDRNILEFFDQPPPIKLEYEAKNGRRVGVLHTPDFFVLYTDSAAWEEWKTEEELVQLAEKMPNRYVRADGHWHCPPGEAYAMQFGLAYHVRSSAELNSIYQRNLVFLEDYFRTDSCTVSEEATTAIRARVTATPGITLAELLQPDEHIDPDDLYMLIAWEQLYADLSAAPLAEPERVRVYLAEAAARASPQQNAPQYPLPTIHALDIVPGATFSWDGQIWTVLNQGDLEITLRPAEGDLISLPNADFTALFQLGKIAGPSPTGISVGGMTSAGRERYAKARTAHHKMAISRAEKIAPYLAGYPPEQGTTSLRTIRSWIALFRKGQQIYGNGYIGLLPEIRNGNCTVRISDEIKKIVEAGVDAYETHKQKTKVAAYGKVVEDCEAQGYDSPSYQYFADLLNQQPKHEQTLKRKGRRAAYPYEPFYLTLDQKTPVHGDFPLAIGHIDHTQLDIELFTSTGKSLGRPWATFLTDAFSRRILAIYLTFDPPSYRSCMMVLRECVRRYKRFPQTIVVDGGKEFKGIYFEALLVYCQSTKKTRPRAKSRFGSVCERLFGTSNTQLIHNMLGNTQIMKNVRQVTKSVNPKNEGVWTLGEFYPVLCEWGYNFYDTTDHPALGMSPREAFAQGQAQSGQRKHRWVDYNDDFIKLTMPTTRKGTAKVQIGAGVKINYLYYSSPSFRPIELKIQAAAALPQGEKKRKKIEETEVEVRYDPYDIGVAYALIDGQWVKCYSQYFTTFCGHSEREIKLASTLLRRKKQRHAQSFTINAKRLAEFLDSVEAKEALLLQRLHDREAKDVFAQMGERLETRDKDAQDELNTLVEGNVTKTQGSLPERQLEDIDEDDDVDLDDLPDFERL